METIKKYEIGIVSKDSNFKTEKIQSSRDSYEYISQFYGDDIVLFESFFVLLLNYANDTVGFAKISQGGIAGTYVDPLIIMKYVVDTMSKTVVIAHNHPSGNLRPSEQDKNMTKKIKDALNLLDVTLLDHIILTETTYLSFADEGLI